MSDPGSLAVLAILVIPAGSAALLAALPDDRTTAWLNVLASLLTFAAALVLLVTRPPVGPFLIVDDLNVVFILLSTFIAFTLFLSWDFSSWQVTTTPVGMCVMRTAESVVFTD